jgi:ATP-binding cassette, subfamily B, bacterial PglK
MMKKFLKLMFEMSTNSEKLKALLLLILLVIVALFDMAGVASIMPFMAVLADPGIANENRILASIVSNISFVNEQNLMFVLGSATLCIIILSLIFKASVSYIQIRFVLMQEFSISSRLVERYLYQKYSWFLERNSAELGKNILSEIQVIMSNAATPLLHLIAHGFVSFALIMLLVSIDFNLAMNVVLILGAAYFILYFFVRGTLKKAGGKRHKANQERFHIVSELFGAIREVKMSRMEHTYNSRFKNSARGYAENQSAARAIAQLPRYFIEGIAFSGMITLILYLLKTRGEFFEIIPIISLYAFAGYRLLPALQQIYASITQLRFIGPTVEALADEIANLKMKEKEISEDLLMLKKEITFNDVSFNYEASTKAAILKASFVLKFGSFTGIVGKTGSGKSTLVDLLLGLLEPQAGTVSVDGRVLGQKNYRSWQSQIGYVPQSVHLIDDTVTRNIAFGLDDKDVDHNAVRKAAKLACALEFITKELPEGFETRVGERGSRLSGGQMQRISIARALYRNPSIVVLDEATSALDVVTERAVLAELSCNLNGLTLIMITHRLSTVANCNQVLHVQDGIVKNVSPSFLNKIENSKDTNSKKDYQNNV